ncbi:MAG: primosomal protein N', partial [Chlorobi bacterium]|nr:primosomal protein N' [Chlorobiota bacterium]
MSRTFDLAVALPQDTLYTYIIPDDMITEDIVGKRALVSFNNRILTAVIIRDNPEPKFAKLKPITEILDDKPVFSDTMLKFAGFIAKYYMCSLGEVLKAALPRGISPKSALSVTIINMPSDSELINMERKAPKRALLLHTLAEYEGDVSVSKLEKQLKSKSITVQLESLEEAGYIRTEQKIELKTKIKIMKAVRIPNLLLNDEIQLRHILDSLDKKAPKQSLMFANILAESQESDRAIIIADISRRLHSDASVVKALNKKGFVEIYEAETDRSEQEEEFSKLAVKNERELTLTEEQKNAVDKINSKIEERIFAPFLLHGITGSGKTLVYIHAITKTLETGKTVLILVPEISLTPQLIDRFNIVFPGRIALLHSRMSAGQRYDAWRSVREGKCNIVLGVRSAIFAPLDNLGLIIVDEEHEPTYKQDSPAPRYNARDAAIIRAKFENAVVVLGSATPSLESMQNVKNGKYELLEIMNRADNAELPVIKIIDSFDAKRNGEMRGAFSKDLIFAIADRVKKKDGVILFQNRRGFSPLTQCSDCGHIPTCCNCEVSMTYHKRSNTMVCHYCGHNFPAYHTCPECGAEKLQELGSGTERIEDELSEALSELGLSASIERMDLDTTSKKGAHRKILHNFATKKTDILIGTQMVAKGLDFDHVTLVGVINADLQLYHQDFRASERTFQLLTQVSGRSGRSGSKKGEVIIQTSHSENEAIQATG